MATQQVNAVKLKKAGTDLTDLSSKLKTEMTKLDESIQKISSIWKSEAGTAYVKTYNEDKANLNQLVQITQQMGATLQQISAKYKQADSKALEAVGRNLAKG
ncbi:MAG: WXG100 family type VII secretion target [Oscillospiraceae bacterium]|nr:WXG100 family type VII secretion target [Oscillospiraceae bacterium]